MGAENPKPSNPENCATPPVDEGAAKASVPTAQTDGAQAEVKTTTAKSDKKATTPAPPPPPPSKRNAVWLVITLINIVLIVFLIPADLLENKQLATLLKVVSFVGAMGAFAAGVVYLKEFVGWLLGNRAFKIAQLVLLGLLLLIHVSQLSVIAAHPMIQPAGAKLEIDGRPREYENGTVRLSIGNHTAKVTSNDGIPREFKITYKDVVGSLFHRYSPAWSPLYQVRIDTNSPDVEVIIVKKDGDFDPDFLKNPPMTELKEKGAANSAEEFRFDPSPNVHNSFVYQGGSDDSGATDHLRLPPGEYELTAQKQGCEKRLVKTLTVGKMGPHKVQFDPLCDTP